MCAATATTRHALLLYPAATVVEHTLASLAAAGITHTTVVVRGSDAAFTFSATKTMHTEVVVDYFSTAASSSISIMPFQCSASGLHLARRHTGTAGRLLVVDGAFAHHPHLIAASASPQTISDHLAVEMRADGWCPDSDTGGGLTVRLAGSGMVDALLTSADPHPYGRSVGIVSLSRESLDSLAALPDKLCTLHAALQARLLTCNHMRLHVCSTNGLPWGPADNEVLVRRCRRSGVNYDFGDAARLRAQCRRIRETESVPCEASV